MRVSLTKSFLRNYQWQLIYSNQTQPNLTAIDNFKNRFVSETGVEKPVFGRLEFRPTLVDFVMTKKNVRESRVTRARTKQ